MANIFNGAVKSTLEGLQINPNIEGFDVDPSNDEKWFYKSCPFDHGPTRKFEAPEALRKVAKKSLGVELPPLRVCTPCYVRLWRLVVTFRFGASAHQTSHGIGIKFGVFPVAFPFIHPFEKPFEESWRPAGSLSQASHLKER